MGRCTGSGLGLQAQVVEFSESYDSYAGLPEVRDRSNFIYFRFVQNAFSVQIQSWIYEGNGAVTSSVKKIVLGGFMTGLGTGLSWSVFVELVSLDHLFSGPEAVLSLILPLLVSLAAWKKGRGSAAGSFADCLSYLGNAPVRARNGWCEYSANDTCWCARGYLLGMPFRALHSCQDVPLIEHS